MSRLPPLNALRAFEAAARHRSFTKAAAELCLTQSAVSRHVRNLEELFGLPLFRRNHRAVTLTPEGQAYMRDVVDAFARMDLATRRIKSVGRQNVVNLHAYTTFAIHWLIPRLVEFQRANPEIDVRLTASVAPLDFDREDIHIAIRTTAGEWDAGIRADKLFDSWLIAVGGSRHQLDRWSLRQPHDLKHVPLLHSLSRIADWKIWLESAGVFEVDAELGPKFESSAMAYLAAQRGMGIAIAQGFLVQDELNAGVLTQVFPHTTRSDRTYFLLTSPRYVGVSAVEIFRCWLLSQLPDATSK